MKRPVIAALRWVGARSAVLGVLVAQGLAWLTRPLGHGIDHDRLSAVFPELDPAASRGVRQRTWENFLKGEAVGAAMVRGRYPPVVPNAQLTALRPPIVLASFHVGPWSAIAAALARLPGEVLALDRGQFGQLPQVSMLPGGEDAGSRAAAFNRALSALRSGGFVFLTVDAFHQEEFDVASIEVPMLGRTLPLARGAFAMARVARVPIVPIVARWRGTALEVELGEAMRVGAGERSLAEAAANWIERYVRARPGEMSVFMLERLQPPVLPG